jgi:oligopeptide/dipeptide ABC transporter ATP-binding protein
VEQIYADPKHPYTQGLLRSVPRLDETNRTRLQTIEGVVPNPLELPSGCAFYARCAFARPQYSETMPELLDVGGGHMVRCYLYEEEAAAVASRR